MSEIWGKVSWYILQCWQLRITTEDPILYDVRAENGPTIVLNIEGLHSSNSIRSQSSCL